MGYAEQHICSNAVNRAGEEGTRRKSNTGPARTPVKVFSQCRRRCYAHTALISMPERMREGGGK